MRPAPFFPCLGPVLMLTGQIQASPLLDEVMGLEAGNAIRFDPLDANHTSVARIEHLGTTVAADGDYQYWYDLVSGNKSWTRDVSFWVSNADTITNLASSNYTETGATNVLQHWWGTPMAHKGLDGWGGHRDQQNSPSHGVGGTWVLTNGHPDPILNQFHSSGDYNVPGHWSFQPTVFFWGPPSRTDDSLILSDGTPVWRFEKNHNAQLLNAGMNPYSYSGLCGTFIIESPNPPAENAFGWSTYHNSTIDGSQSEVAAYGYLPGPGSGTPATVLTLSISEVAGLLDFSWNSQAGMQYDLVSSTDLSTPPATWPSYDDGATRHEKILPSGTGTNTLSGVSPSGSTRFFAIVEKELGPLLLEDFDGSVDLPAGWTTSGSGTTAWEVGIPVETEFGPQAASSSPHCVGTNIAGDYTASQDISLVSPVIPIPVTGASLSYQQWRDTEGDGDAASIRILDADNGNALLAELVTNIEWNDVTWNASDQVALPPEANGKNVKIEFNFLSNKSNPETYAGVYFDDIMVKAN